MDLEVARKCIESTDTDCTIKNRVPKGLNILMGFDPDVQCRFDHDQMWASDFEATVNMMGASAVLSLAQLGWFESENSWSHF